MQLCHAAVDRYQDFRARQASALQYIQSDRTTTDYGDAFSHLHLRHPERGTDSGYNGTTQQTGTIQRHLTGNANRPPLRNDAQL
jgi:hypothetical protein